MLNLNTPDTPGIANKHFDGVSYYINQVLDYYINAFDILIGNKSTADAIDILYDGSDLDAKTVNVLGGKLSFKKKAETKITKGKIVGIYAEPKKNFNQLFLDHKADFKLFFEELKSKLKEIIISEPKELLELEKALKTKYPFIINAYDSFKEPVRRLLLLSVFNYNKFSNKIGFPKNKSKSSYWERYDLADELNVNTCAYCNRIYTFTIFNIDGKGIVSPTIDHFFDKAKNPLFALSFYNLIPSCTNCNSTLKGQEEFTLEDYVHPYLSGFGEHAKFSYTALDTDATKGESKNLKIYIKPKPTSPIKDQIEKSTELFQLDKIYSEHADYVQELIKKKIMSNSRYLEILRFDTYKNLNLSLEESYRLAFGNYFLEKDFQKRPLAKLTKDLVEELKMI